MTAAHRNYFNLGLFAAGLLATVPLVAQERPQEVQGRVPVCEGVDIHGRARYATDQWLLEVNKGNQATKEGLLRTFGLAGTGGFSTSILTLGDHFLVTLKFSKSYYVDTAKGAQVKASVLAGIASIPGNILSCTGLMYPAVD